MKKVFLILVLFLFLFVAYKVNDKIHLKAELKIENLSARYIDENIASNLRREILSIPDIKNVYTFSSEYGLNLYCKIRPFCLNKQKVISMIKTKIFLFSKDKSEIIKDILIDEEYDLKYSYLIVVSHDDYFELKKEANDVLDDILKHHEVRKVKLCNDLSFANYINYNSQKLQNYDLSLDDIKNYVIKNNSKINFDIQNKLGFSINSNISSYEDLKNISIPYFDKNFFVFLSDIFEINQEIKKTFSSFAFLNKQKAITFALCKKSFYPQILLELKLNKIKNKNVKIFKINKLAKIEIFLEKNIDNSDLISFCKELNELINVEVLCFAKSNPLDNGLFSEFCNNRLVVYFNPQHKKKILKILKDKNINYFDSRIQTKKVYFDKASDFKNRNIFSGENLGTRTKKFIFYEIKKEKLEEYGFKTDEINSFLLSRANGLFLDSYLKEGIKFDIYLKNNDIKDDFIYSKKKKMLVDVNLFLNQNLVDDFEVISNENGKYFQIIQFKNPSIIRRVESEFRYLLSLF